VALEYSNKRNALRLLRYGRRSLREDHEHYGELLFGTHPRLFSQLAASAGFEVRASYGTGFFSRLLDDRTKAAYGALAAAERLADAALGKFELAPMHFVDLRRLGTAAAPPPTQPSLTDILQCPACGGALRDGSGGVECAACERQFARTGKVLDLRYVGELA
jgi:hypothetical protein